MIMIMIIKFIYDKIYILHKINKKLTYIKNLMIAKYINIFHILLKGKHKTGSHIPQNYKKLNL